VYPYNFGAFWSLGFALGGVPVVVALVVAVTAVVVVVVVVVALFGCDSG